MKIIDIIEKCILVLLVVIVIVFKFLAYHTFLLWYHPVDLID